MILLWLLAAAALAEPPAARVEVVPLARAPKGAPLPQLNSTVPVVRVATEPAIDGRFEPLWLQARPARPPRALSRQAPPDPRWRFAAMATPGGLAIALQDVPTSARTDIAVDPDGSRRGWIQVSIDGGVATQSDCRADPTDADMPIDHKWSVYTWDCKPAAPAIATSGDRGWEILVPWSALEPTTDDMRINWWVETDKATATFDASGRKRSYAASARPIELVDSPERSDSVTVWPDHARGITRLTLGARVLPTSETWIWETSFNGRPLDSGRVERAPNARGRGSAQVEIPVARVDGVSFVARRDTTEPLRPGAWRGPWYELRRGSMATPVHTDRIELSTWLDAPEQGVPVEVRAPDGRVLAVSPVDLPRGTAQVFVERDPSWPTVVEVAVGDIFREGHLPTVHVGGTP